MDYPDKEHPLDVVYTAIGALQELENNPPSADKHKVALLRFFMI